MTAKRYPSPHDLVRVNLGQVAGEIDRSKPQTAKLLKKMGFLGLRPRRTKGAITYDGSCLEVLKATLTIPHRVIGNPADDWLSRYTDQGATDGT